MNQHNERKTIRERTIRTKQVCFKINMSTPISNLAFNIFLWGGEGEGKGELYL